MPKLAVVYALNTTTVTREGGVGVTIVAGQHWPASDPLVKDYPNLFTDDPAAIGLRISVPLADQGVEQATAAPGEKRQTRKKSE